MRDRLKKYRKEDQAEKRFGKDISVSTMDETPMRKTPDTIDVKGPSRLRESKPAAGGSSFGAAFAAARKAGDKTFTWRGKSFTTEMAGEKKAAPARSAPAKAPASTPAKIPAPAKAVADRAAGYRAMFQRSDGTAGFTKDTPKPKAEPKQDPNWGRKVIAKRDAEAAAKRRFLPDGRLNPAAVRKDGTVDMSYKAKGGSVKGYAKGGSIDGCAVRGKTKAGRK